jgi:hypothetical protein
MRTSVLLILSLLPAVVFGGQLRTESFHGDVVVRSSGEKQMVVLLDSFGRGDVHDGLADHAWVIASETPYADPVSICLRNALVISEPRRVTVFSAADETTIVFLLESSETESNCPVHRYAGYGLSQYRGVLDLNGPDPWGEMDSGPAASQ